MREMRFLPKRQFITFLIVGGLLFAADTGTLLILLNMGQDKILANFFSTGLATLLAFFAHYSITFRKDQKSSRTKAFPKYVLISGVLWVVNFSGSSWFLYLVENLSEMWIVFMKAITVVTIALLRFFLLKGYVYR